MCRKVICLVFFVLAFGLALSSNALAGATQFDFRGDLSATFGAGTVDYYNGARTSNTVSFGTASSFGLPALPGGDATVMRFPAFAPDQGLLLEPASGANGGGNYINQYTMIWDLFIPDVSANWTSLYNTSATNSNDGDFFIRQDGGIGISGVYHGKVNSGQWHRIAVVLDLVAGTMAKYIDGVHVATQAASGVDGRWSMYTTGHGIKTYLLTDEDNETNSGYISSFCFVDKALDASTIAGLGGPDADGVGISAFAKADNPNPPDGAKNVITPLVQWTAGEGAAFHDVYFGTNPTPGAAEFRARQPVSSTLYWHEAGIVAGTTYYWRIDEVEADGTTIHTGDVWSFTAASSTAHSPDPPNGAKYVPTDLTLSWGAGATAITHDVYFGTDQAAVAGGTGSTFKGNQGGTSYTPAGLANDTTYYWRIDEVEAGGAKKHKGEVWSFRTRPAMPIVDPNLVGWWKLDEASGTTALDWSGYGNDGTFVGQPQWVEGIIDGALELNGNDFVRMDSVADDIPSNNMSMGAWVKFTSPGEEGILCVNTGGGDNVILMEHDGAQIGMWESSYEVWSGVALDDGEWHHVMYTRSGSTGTLYTDGVRRGTHTADFTLSSSDRWSIGQEWDTGGPSEFLIGTVDDARVYKVALTQAQIAEVIRGDTIRAWDPKPANRSVPDIEQASSLSWSPGDKAAQHDVYFGTDKDAVNDAGTSDATGIYRGRQLAASYSPAALEWGQTYYWRIDEYNTDASVSKGRVWSFTVADYLTVDDFEDYTDDIGNRIFQTWRDGWGYTQPPPGYSGNGTGSAVGNSTAPFAEQTIVHSGKQSMPFEYVNDGSTGKARYSETQREWAVPQDFARKGVKALTLWFRGYPASVGSFSYDAAAGIYTMTAAGEDIWGTSDEFHYAFKRLSGVGSIQVKVLSVSNTHNWAKAGVMIRDTLDPNSAHAMVVMTPGNGVAFQYRGTAGGTSGNANQTGITSPHWVKLERGLAGTFTAYHSSDGKAWTQLDQPVSIGMQSEVYIGLALTSNDPALTCEARFSDLATTATVTGQWQSQDIGIASNDAEQLYVALEDTTGKNAVVRHKDPNAVLLDTWQEWNVDLKEFSTTAVNLSGIKKMYLGVGDRSNPKAGGTGRLYFDDIRLHRPRCLPSLLRPDADLSGNCVVDYPDLQVMAEDWLLAAADPGGVNLAGWWRFDGNANDSSGKAIHGRPVGNPNYAAGHDGSALELDGNDHIVLGTSSDLNFADSTDFSVALWVKTAGWQNDAAIISNKDWDSGSNTGWAIAGESGGSGSWQWNYKGAIGGRRDYDPPGPTLSDGQWHHLCVTHDRNGYAKFYFDGLYQDQRDISGSTGSINAGYPTVIGTDGAEGKVWAYWFIGLVDDVRIYNKALTQAEVLYLAGARLRLDLAEDGKIDLKDYAALADAWLDELLWPQP
jgi:hypothetical protein